MRGETQVQRYNCDSGGAYWRGGKKHSHRGFCHCSKLGACKQYLEHLLVIVCDWSMLLQLSHITCIVSQQVSQNDQTWWSTHIKPSSIWSGFPHWVVIYYSKYTLSQPIVTNMVTFSPPIISSCHPTYFHSFHFLLSWLLHCVRSVLVSLNHKTCLLSISPGMVL